MRALLVILLVLALPGCTQLPALILPPSNMEIALQMEQQLDQQQLLAADQLYQSLSISQQDDPAIQQQRRRLVQQLSTIRTQTEQQADAAIAQGDWSKAATIYHQQQPLIAIDEAFHTNYARFLTKIDQQKQPTQNEFLLIEANYLIEKRKMLRQIQQLDPHDSNNQLQLEATEKAAKVVSKQLLALGMDAVQSNNINSARIMIPLAKRLNNTKTVREASRVLEQLTTPLADYISKLTDYGTELYSNEDYKNAFEIWEVILYLDPNNEKVKANRDRTEKVLKSLEKIKQDAVDKTGQQS